MLPIGDGAGHLQAVFEKCRYEILRKARYLLNKSKSGMGNIICEKCGQAIDQGGRHVVVSVSYSGPIEFNGATVEALEKIGDVRYHLSCAPAKLEIAGKRFAVKRSETERSETER